MAATAILEMGWGQRGGDRCDGLAILQMAVTQWEDGATTWC